MAKVTKKAMALAMKEMSDTHESLVRAYNTVLDQRNEYQQQCVQLQEHADVVKRVLNTFLRRVKSNLTEQVDFIPQPIEGDLVRENLLKLMNYLDQNTIPELEDLVRYINEGYIK